MLLVKMGQGSPSYFPQEILNQIRMGIVSSIKKELCVDNRYPQSFFQSTDKGWISAIHKYPASTLESNIILV